MEILDFRGPFQFKGESSIFNDITGVISGVYLWCVKNEDNSFRVYYVGEAVNIKQRMLTHLKNLLEGKYTGHCVKSLRNNIQIIMHRAGEGVRITSSSNQIEALSNYEVVI